ncbi:MAG TPA: SIMPL domain-containing protein [Burkholderiaceae bacterium]
MKAIQAMAMVLAIAGSCATWAQELPASPTLQNVLEFSAAGTAEVPQDLLTLRLTTNREGSEAAIVQAQLVQALDAALSEARKTALLEQLDVRTGQFGLYPRYGKDGKINGWQGNTELVLEGRDFARITAAAARVQTLSVSQVGFSLSREQRAKAQAEAQSQAVEQFKQRAGELTKSFGFASYSLREVAVDSSDTQPGPRPRMLAMEAKAVMADAPVPVEAGRGMVTVTVSGSVQMR